MRHKRFGFVLTVTALAFGAAIASSAWAKTVRVIKKDGREIVGQLISDDGKILKISIKGNPIPYVVDRAEVRELIQEKSVNEEFAARRAKIANGDLDARVDLAKWAYERDAYSLADKELAEVLKIAPNHTRALLIRRLVKAKLDVLARQGDDTPATQRPPRVKPVTPKPPNGGAPNPAAKAGDAPDKRLTPEDVNTIRLFEYNLNEKKKPSVIIPKNVIDEMFEKFRDDERVPKGRTAQGRFRRAAGWEQLGLLFTLGARDLWMQGEVRGDPEAMRTFRTSIHNRYVMNYCGTVGCHGGNNYGGVFLFRNVPNSEQTVYTNFFILDSFENQAGYMIDRTEPERSLLLEYGIPAEEARTPHPPVPGLRPALRLGKNDRQYKIVYDWISNQLYRPKPRYPISYTLPKRPKPAEEPAPKAPDGATPGTPPARPNPAPATSTTPPPSR